MATLAHPSSPARVSVDDYLAMSFEGPDAEYVDGAIVERAVPKRPHAKAQQALAGAFHPLRDTHGVDPYPELRLRLGPETVRVPDYCVFRSPIEDDVPDTPPMLAVEIVSPTDVHSSLMRKLEDYRAWGVENIWVVDPATRTLAVYRRDGLIRVEELALAELGVRFTGPDLFD